MLDSRQRACLAELGIDVYVRRGLAVAEQSLSIAAPEVPAAAMPPVASPGPEATLDWEPLCGMVLGCTRCELHATRTQAVFGVGSRTARWMVIGEAPGAEEDKRGEPFVGRAGQLLTSMLRAVGLRREDVYIANTLKCRPPGNRDPKPAEAVACRGYLERQIELVNPALIVAVGRIAAQNLLATDTPLARLRGRVHVLGAAARPVVVTYHPAYLLRSPSEKRKAWQDLLFARQAIDPLADRTGAAP